MKRLLIATLAAALLGLVAPVHHASAQLPASTKKILEQWKLDPALMKGIDEELLVPPEWIEGAKKEGSVKILGSWDPGQFNAMVAPFKERYPWLRMDYSRGDFSVRAINPAMAAQQGRFITDVITGFGGSDSAYRSAGTLEDLRPIPGFKNPLPGSSDPDGLWVAARLRYWCMSYNTQLVKKESLPKTWDDLLTGPEWHNGNIGTDSRPQLWLLMLQREHGRAWVDNFMEKFFSVVKPQQRKEGANAMMTLVIAGEMHVSIPAADYRVKQYADRGAPISWHCPEPIPMAVSQLGILKGNPHPNASRVWVNWFLSKEGQIAQFHGDLATPAHKDLQIIDFIPFPEQLKGRKIAARVPESVVEIDALNENWMKYWTKSGGSAEHKK